MQSWVRVSAVVLVALATVALKIAALARIADSADGGAAEVAAFLGRQAFLVQQIDTTSDPVMVEGVAGPCMLKVYIVSPHGWHRALIRQLAPPPESAFFVYGGEVFPEQPVWTTWAQFQWWHANAIVGRRLPVRLVLGVVETPGCVGQPLPWSEIATLPLASASPGPGLSEPPPHVNM